MCVSPCRSPGICWSNPYKVRLLAQKSEIFGSYGGLQSGVVTTSTSRLLTPTSTTDHEECGDRECYGWPGTPSKSRQDPAEQPKSEMNKHNWPSAIARWLSEMRDPENINTNVQQVAVNLKDRKAERRGFPLLPRPRWKSILLCQSRHGSPVPHAFCRTHALPCDAEEECPRMMRCGAAVRQERRLHMRYTLHSPHNSSCSWHQHVAPFHSCMS